MDVVLHLIVYYAQNHPENFVPPFSHDDHICDIPLKRRIYTICLEISAYCKNESKKELTKHKRQKSTIPISQKKRKLFYLQENPYRRPPRTACGSDS